jgi:hypothetical protein
MYIRAKEAVGVQRSDAGVNFVIPEDEIFLGG